jgi:hypothetical protein
LKLLFVDFARSSAGQSQDSNLTRWSLEIVDQDSQQPNKHCSPASNL